MSAIKQKIRPISFNNDLFFKHSLAGKDQDSKTLREGIIEEVLHRSFEELQIINPEITPDMVNGKGIRLDILLKDRSTGELVNIEMQVSRYKLNEAKRFQYYGSRLITDQSLRGEEYSQLVTTYQIIFIDDVLEGREVLVNSYTLKDDTGEEVLGCLNHQVYVYLPTINKIVKRKGIKQLSEFEKICYLFKNNKDDAIIKATKETEGMAKILMDKYEEFPKEKELWSLARALEDGRMTMNTRLKDSHDEGVEEGVRKGLEQGIEQGLEQGKIALIAILTKAIKKSYQEDASDWLKTLSALQLDSVMDVLLEVDDFTTFKQVVEKRG